jgi:hypothetical protein
MAKTKMNEGITQGNGVRAELYLIRTARVLRLATRIPKMHRTRVFGEVDTVSAGPTSFVMLPLAEAEASPIHR